MKTAALNAAIGGVVGAFAGGVGAAPGAAGGAIAGAVLGAALGTAREFINPIVHRRRFNHRLRKARRAIAKLEKQPDSARRRRTADRRLEHAQKLLSKHNLYPTGRQLRRLGSLLERRHEVDQRAAAATHVEAQQSPEALMHNLGYGVADPSRAGAR